MNLVIIFVSKKPDILLLDLLQHMCITHQRSSLIFHRHCHLYGHNTHAHSHDVPGGTTSFDGEKHPDLMEIKRMEVRDKFFADRQGQILYEK